MAKGTSEVRKIGERTSIQGAATGLHDGSAAPGYVLLMFNLLEGQRLYRGTPCMHVADVVAIQGGEVTIRTLADGDLVTFSRAFVQSKFVTKP